MWSPSTRCVGRRRERGRDLVLVEVLFPKQFLGQPQNRRPILFDEKLGLDFDPAVEPTTVFGRFRHQAEDARNNLVVMLTHSIIKLTTRTEGMLRNLACFQTDK